MVAAVQSEPTTLAEYLSSPVESPSDVAPESELLAESDGLNDEQSSDDVEQVAPDNDSEQPEETDDSEVALDGDSSPAEPASASIDWDSPDNPHFQASQVLKQLADDAARKQREAEEQALQQKRVDVMKRLASGEIDDDDIPIITGEFVQEISTHAIAPYREEADMLRNGMSGLVAAVRELPAEQQQFLIERSKFYRETGGNADQIEAVFNASQAVRQQESVKVTALEKKVKALTAQLAAKTIQDSGVNRTESTAVGSGSIEEYQTMGDYLRSGPL